MFNEIIPNKFNFMFDDKILKFDVRAQVQCIYIILRTYH